MIVGHLLADTKAQPKEARALTAFVSIAARLGFVAIAVAMFAAGCATTPKTGDATTPRRGEQTSPDESFGEDSIVDEDDRTDTGTAGEDAVAVPTLMAKVVDVGQGLCVLLYTPSEDLIVYDTGLNSRCAKAARRLVGRRHTDVALLVLSHEDTDHIGGFRAFVKEFEVKQVIRTGYDRSDDEIKTWERNEAIFEEFEGIDSNLATVSLPPGTQFKFGEVEQTKLTIVAGWHSPPFDWQVDGEAERRNAASLVVRVEYDGKAILLPGDTIGRPVDADPIYDEVCESAEEFMVENAARVTLKSDVLVAPHHGANNGSSMCFIEAVDPTYVIFSAGRGHCHPRKAVVKRYAAAGVRFENMRRTDTGDNENLKRRCHQSEWGLGGGDETGDDTVTVKFERGNPRALVFGGNR